jgi:CO/xanthine dehydrogenase Mo-binding subunit
VNNLFITASQVGKFSLHGDVPSDGPGRVGEPGTPPTTATLANALLVLTGEGVRDLPILS